MQKQQVTRKVLVVEDQKEVRELTSNFLSGLGWAVTSASSGEEALAILVSERFKAMVTDLDLGGSKSGFDVLAEAARRNPGIVCIVVSGRADVFDEELKMAGATHVLPKPFKPDHLKELLSSI